MTVQQSHLSHPKYRPDIDGLRALAVLAVVAFHAFPVWVRGGFIGVDVFFVISGYLISTIIFENLEKGTFSFSEFYARRIRRIFPALLLVLTACFAFGWFALLPDEFKQLGKHIAAGAAFVSNFVLWGEAGYFDNSADTKPLLHLWSLGIEEQFYIIWPPLLWLAWKRKFNLLTITIVVAIASFVLNLDSIKQDPIATFYSPLTRFWELLCGSVLAWLTLYKLDACVNIKNTVDRVLVAVVYGDRRESDGRLLSNVLSFIGFFLLIYGFWRINRELSFPGKWALVPVMGAVLIITAGSQAWVNRVFLSNRLAVWFGLISFPLYLWHWPLLSFARIIESQEPSFTVQITAVVLSVILAWLTYRLIERPIRLGDHGKAKVIILVTLMALIGYVGYNTDVRNGLAFRFPKVIRELVNYKYDAASSFREGTCFLKPEQDYKDFSGCSDSFSSTEGAVVIWGDSYAAHLYSGYSELFKNPESLVQRTASACPPILGLEVNKPGEFDRPFCTNINNKIFDELKTHNIKKIILAANWGLYDWEKITTTINSLKKIGISNIELVGPVPQYKETVPKQLYISFKQDAFHRVPYRINFGLIQKNFDIDKRMRQLAENEKIKYISPIDILCTPDTGCLARIGESTEELITWDKGHLTKTGSKFLVSKFPLN